MQIKIRGKSLEVRKCSSIFEKARGLMFKKNSIPLLFIFKKLTKQPIHSLFCPPFKAIWLKDNKIIEEKIINSWKLSIRPQEKFNKLIEIPLSNNMTTSISRRE